MMRGDAADTMNLEEDNWVDELTEVEATQLQDMKKRAAIPQKSESQYFSHWTQYKTFGVDNKKKDLESADTLLLFFGAHPGSPNPWKASTLWTKMSAIKSFLRLDNPKFETPPEVEAYLSVCFFIPTSTDLGRPNKKSTSPNNRIYSPKTKSTIGLEKLKGQTRTLLEELLHVLPCVVL